MVDNIRTQVLAFVTGSNDCFNSFLHCSVFVLVITDDVLRWLSYYSYARTGSRRNLFSFVGITSATLRAYTIIVHDGHFTGRHPKPVCN